MYRNSPLPIFHPSRQFPGNLPLVPSKAADTPGLCWIIWEHRWRREQDVPGTSQIFLQTEKHPLKSLPALSAVFTHSCFHPANTSVLETHKDLLGNGISLQFPKCFRSHTPHGIQEGFGSPDLLGSTWQGPGENTPVVSVSSWSYLQLLVLAGSLKSKT